MRRIFVLLAAVVAVIAGACWFHAAAQEQTPQPWGTFIWWTTMGTGGEALPALLTLHQDGAVAVADSAMFGAQPGSPSRISPLQGVWERTGPKTVGGSSLFLVFDAAGGLTAIARSRVSLQFSDDFREFRGMMSVDIAPCAFGPVFCPDPTDTKTTWQPSSNMPPTGVPVFGTRFQRVPQGPLP